jgi:response regulator RpfG family c-di-GMP phosphodiesterase
MKPISMILLLTNRPSSDTVLAKILSRDLAGYQVIGFDGIKTLLEGLSVEGDLAPLELRPCLILLDWICPDEECIGMVTRLKEEPKIQKVPILVVSERSDPAVVHRCYALNASFYLIRPVDTQAIQTFIRHLGQFLALEGVKLPMIRHRWSVDPAIAAR